MVKHMWFESSIIIIKKRIACLCSITKYFVRDNKQKSITYWITFDFPCIGLIALCSLCFSTYSLIFYAISLLHCCLLCCSSQIFEYESIDYSYSSVHNHIFYHYTLVSTDCFHISLISVCQFCCLSPLWTGI